LELEPSDTLPKLTDAGLALSAADAELVEFAVLAAAAAELPFALVTPAQPERIVAENKSVPERKSIRTRGMGRAALRTCVIMTREV
jgi:hypothetical protein